MNKIRVIDLLNKIANGEEVPKKIKYRNQIFIYDKDNQCYVVENYNEYYDLHMSLSNHKGTDLNYEVEIIEEEKKIPEKLFFTHISNYNDQSVVNNNFNNYFKKTQETINQLIDYLDYLKSKGE